MLRVGSLLFWQAFFSKKVRPKAEKLIFIAEIAQKCCENGKNNQEIFGLEPLFFAKISQLGGLRTFTTCSSPNCWQMSRHDTTFLNSFLHTNVMSCHVSAEEANVATCLRHRSARNLGKCRKECRDILGQGKCQRAGLAVPASAVVLTCGGVCRCAA